MDRIVTRGDTPEKAYKLFDPLTEPLDLAGHTVWLTVKPAIDNDLTDSAALLKHYIVFDAAGAVTDSAGFRVGGTDPDESSPTYGDNVTGASSGVVTHVIPIDDSQLLTIGVHVYDLQVMGPELPDGSRYFETPVRGARFEVVGDVTRRITTP